jgi:hypothetical protein
MKADQLLEHAAGIVTRRRRDYGDPTLLFERIAQRWSLTLGIDVTAAQAVACMIDVKLARLSHDPGHVTASPTSRATPAVWRRCCTMAELRSYLGRHQPTPIDRDVEKRVGWREYGILVVAEEDTRLTWPERQLIRQLGAKLYGKRKEGAQ